MLVGLLQQAKMYLISVAWCERSGANDNSVFDKSGLPILFFILNLFMVSAFYI